MARLDVAARFCALAVAAMLAAALSAPSSPPAWAGERQAPPITGDTWLNSPPLSARDLQGRVVLVEFWTFACWNCRNVEPYIKAWHETYQAQGLTVIGVHSPELAFERDTRALGRYVREHRIDYPVVVDNGFDNWHAWHNRAWPTLWLVDKKGVIRYQRIGEGGYAETESMIRRLLAE